MSQLRSKTAALFRIVAAISLVTVASHAGDWPSYRGPNHDGTAPNTTLDWPKGGPKVLWKIPTPNGFSSFAVGDGRAFTQVGRTVEGVPQEVVIALDATNGNELWSYPLGFMKYGNDGGNSGAPGNDGGDGPRSTPVISGDHVYVLSSDLGLYCFKASSGEVVWSKDLLRQHNGENIKWKNAASPLIDGGAIYVAGGGRGQALLAINKTDGDVLWKTQNDLMTHATPSLATIHGVPQIIFFTQEGLVSLKRDDGAVLWRYPFRFSVSTAASPVVAGDLVYCSAGYGVGAGLVRVIKNGNEFKAEEVWRKPGGLQNHWSTPIHKDGYLYGMFSFKEYGSGPIKCVELATGKEMWSKEGFGPGNVALIGDNILALGDAGQLALFKATPEKYEELGRAHVLNGKCWSSPAVEGGKVYVRSTVEAALLDFGGAGTSGSSESKWANLSQNLTDHWHTTGAWTRNADGVFTLTPRPGESGWSRWPAYLWSKEEYKNFEIKFDYRVQPRGNSGFYFNVGDKDDPVAKGIEIQIYDSGSKEQGARLTDHDSGGIIPGVPPSKNTAKPAGEWNTFHITINDGKAVVRLNGSVVNELSLDHPRLQDRPDSGYIGFQDHGLPLSLRNIQVRRL